MTTMPFKAIGKKRTLGDSALESPIVSTRKVSEGGPTPIQNSYKTVTPLYLDFTDARDRATQDRLWTDPKAPVSPLES